MALFESSHRQLVEAVSYLTYCNPFLPERIEYEKKALGESFESTAADWNAHIESEGNHPNIIATYQKSEQLLNVIRQRLLDKPKQSLDEIQLYEDLALFTLYHRYRENFNRLVEDMSQDLSERPKVDFYTAFEKDFVFYFELPSVPIKPWYQPEHGFAIYFQMRRAFYYIFNFIVGRSKPTMRLRGMVWQSIFTHDLRRYAKSLYGRMGDLSTLVLGPSGTGKELVARAIGHSRYVPFDPKSNRFTEDFRGAFYPLNLSAMSPTLIESELFGHQKGAFTGATVDRQGWLEKCPKLGTVFLDEIGELDLAIQVKLLRVLQSKRFQRVGGSEDLEFQGKVIAATNRSLGAMIGERKFRKDLYYRLCSDMIRVPSLRDRVVDCPEELEGLVLFLCKQLVEEEAEPLADEVMQWIQGPLGKEYSWPGNVRELEQCIRNILVRKEYWPTPLENQLGGESMAEPLTDSNLTADDLLRYYCTLVYVKSGENTEEAARRLNLDRRTVKAKINQEVLDRLRST